ncbi:MAG: BMP family ABC transporter substrate-binding protein [Gaiellaceae bacterium]
MPSRSNRTIRTQVDFTRATSDPTACERIANAQVDAGADVIFAAAGRCGLGAIAVARTRGIWGIGAEEDGLSSEANIIGLTIKDWHRAIQRSIAHFKVERLPRGEDLELGLEADYYVVLDMSRLSPVVPESIKSKVVAYCSEIRHAADGA